jgi:hypothetical protein
MRHTYDNDEQKELPALCVRCGVLKAPGQGGHWRNWKRVARRECQPGHFTISFARNTVRTLLSRPSILRPALQAALEKAEADNTVVTMTIGS